MTPKKLALALATTGALAAIPAAAADTFTIDPGHTYPSFEVMHFSFSMTRGRFNKTSGKVTLDTAGKKGSVDIVIDAGSVDTGLDKLEQELRGENFFNAAKHPTITFKSDSFAFDGDKVKSVTGNLTLLGVSKPVTLAANHFNCGPHPMFKKLTCGGDFQATVKRSDFGMKAFIPAISDEVTLRIQVEALKD